MKLIDLIKKYPYKHRIPIDSPCDICQDNKAVAKKTQRLDNGREFILLVCGKCENTHWSSPKNDQKETSRNSRRTQEAQT